MKSLDDLYIILLRRGFILLRLAVDSQNYEWIQAEVELLHNVPSLIGETNMLRHNYFWEAERMAYIEWVEENKNSNNDYEENMQDYYEPTWKKMGEIIENLKT